MKCAVELAEYEGENFEALLIVQKFEPEEKKRP